VYSREGILVMLHQLHIGLPHIFKAYLEHMHQAAAVVAAEAAALARFSPVPHLLLRPSLNVKSPSQPLGFLIMMWMIIVVLPLRRR
jgi:hypothetical protein